MSAAEWLDQIEAHLHYADLFPITLTSMLKKDAAALVAALRAVLELCDAAVTNQDGSWADADIIERAITEALA